MRTTIVGQLLADGLEVGDGLAELDPLERVLGRLLDDQLAATQIGGAQLEAADVECVEGDRHAAARLAEEVLLGHHGHRPG